MIMKKVYIDPDNENTMIIDHGTNNTIRIEFDERDVVQMIDSGSVLVVRCERFYHIRDKRRNMTVFTLNLFTTEFNKYIELYRDLKKLN